MFSMRRFVISVFLLALSGCGFQLRGAANLPFETLYVAAPPTSTFATQLRRAVTSGSQTKVVNNRCLPADVCVNFN